MKLFVIKLATGRYIVKKKKYFNDFFFKQLITLY